MTTQTNHTPETGMVGRFATRVARRFLEKVQSTDQPSRFASWLTEEVVAPVLTDPETQDGVADLIHSELTDSVQQIREAVPNGYTVMEADLAGTEGDVYGIIRESIRTPNEGWISRGLKWVFAKALSLGMKLPAYMTVAFVDKYYYRYETENKPLAYSPREGEEVLETTGQHKVIRKTVRFTDEEISEQKGTVARWFAKYTGEGLGAVFNKRPARRTQQAPALVLA